MKRLITSSLVIMSVFACSPGISTTAHSTFQCVLVPTQNRELQHLQMNLADYWVSNNQHWPANASRLRDYCDSTGSPVSSKFNKLAIQSVADSAVVAYELSYDEADETAYEKISGDLSMKVINDSIASMTYQTARVDMKNGTTCTSTDAARGQMTIRRSQHEE